MRDNDDLRLGRLLVKGGHLREAVLHTVLAEQERMARSGAEAPRLGQMLIERGFVSAAVVQATLARQFKTALRCVPCRLRFLVERLSRATPRCPKCGGDLLRDDLSSQIVSMGRTDLHPSLRVKPKEPSARPPSRRRAWMGAALLATLACGGAAACLHRHTERPPAPLAQAVEPSPDRDVRDPAWERVRARVRELCDKEDFGQATTELNAFPSDTDLRTVEVASAIEEVRANAHRAFEALDKRAQARLARDDDSGAIAEYVKVCAWGMDDLSERAARLAAEVDDRRKRAERQTADARGR